MKTKLLKKVRRRFEIVHYPNGEPTYYKDGTSYVHPWEMVGGSVKLHDKKGEITKTAYLASDPSVEDAFERCKEKMLDYYRAQYPKSRSAIRSKQKYKGIKLWWNG